MASDGQIEGGAAEGEKEPEERGIVVVGVNGDELERDEIAGNGAGTDEEFSLVTLVMTAAAARAFGLLKLSAHISAKPLHPRYHLPYRSKLYSASKPCQIKNAAPFNPVCNEPYSIFSL